MKIRLMCGVFLAFSCWALPLQAAPTWTVTFTGTILFGYDSSGVFGQKDRVLSGLHFAQSITASADSGSWSNGEGFDTEVGHYRRFLSGEGPGFINSVTVDGQTAVLKAVTTTWGRQLVAESEISSTQTGVTADGGTMIANQGVYSGADHFVPKLSFAQNIYQDISKPHFSSGLRFSVSGIDEANFWGTSFRHVRVEYGSAAVPEPSPLILSISALFAVMLLMSRNTFLHSMRKWPFSRLSK